MKLFIILFLVFSLLLGGCSTNSISSEDYIEEVVVGQDVLKYEDTVSDEEIVDEVIAIEMGIKRKEIERRLEEKRQRKEALENITFEYEYIVSEDYMPYGLFTPSVVKYISRMPLIVWLHGSGERGVDENVFNQRGLVGVLNNWELKGFSAYVLCPQLKGVGYNTSWNNEDSRENLMSLIDYFKENYPIDENRIYIVGHSLGAQGALYMTQKEDCFAAQGLLSGYPAYIDIINTEIPTKCFVGTVSGGEDSRSVDFTLSQLSSYYGENSITIVNTFHAGVPKSVFSIDEDGDSQSDFVNWLLNQ